MANLKSNVWWHCFPALLLIIVVSVGTVANAQTCDISTDKEEIIRKLLCGQFAPEAEYHFYGQNCFPKSMAVRAEDSAAHNAILSKCGHPELAKELAIANEVLSEALVKLGNCTGQNADFKAIYRSAATKVERKKGSLNCTWKLRRWSKDSLPGFRSLIEQTQSINFFQILISPIGLTVDGVGNISD